MKTYAFAIMPSRGRYASHHRVTPIRCTDDYRTATLVADRATLMIRREMRSVGGTSGGYRVISWGRGARDSIQGMDLDTTTDA